MVIDGIEWTPEGPEDKAYTRRVVNQWEIDWLWSVKALNVPWVGQIGETMVPWPMYGSMGE